MRVIAERRACSILRNLALDAAPGTFLLPANVCPVVPLTLLTVGRPFEFVDIDAGDLCMCRTALEARLHTEGPAVSGVVFVRTYGAQFDLSDTFRAWKRSHGNLLLIDDRCACRPDVDDCDPQGADVVLFSTGYAKYVDLGYGGFAYLTDDVDYTPHPAPFAAEDATRLMDLYKIHIARGSALSPYPSRRDLGDWIPSAPLDTPVDAYLGEVRALIGPASEHKARLNEIYRRAIPESVCLDLEYCQWRFQIRLPDKRTLLDRIFRSGHFASDHYYPASSLFGAPPAPQAEALYSDIVNLFNDFAMTPQAATAVGDLVRDHLGD